MPRLRDVTRRERRARIADAALRCFARSGIHATSMADIIEESGLSSGAIYSHFDTKSDLVRFAMTNLLEDRFTALAAPTPGGSHTEVVPPRSLLEQLLTGPAEHREQTRLLLQVWAEMARDAELATVAEENITHLHQILTDALLPWAQDRTDPSETPEHTSRAAAELLVTLLFGYTTRLALQPATDAAALRSVLLTTSP